MQPLTAVVPGHLLIETGGPACDHCHAPFRSFFAYASRSETRRFRLQCHYQSNFQAATSSADQVLQL